MNIQKYICEFCKKEKLFTNQYNKDVHQTACKTKLKGKRSMGAGASVKTSPSQQLIQEQVTCILSCFSIVQSNKEG